MDSSHLTYKPSEVHTDAVCTSKYLTFTTTAACRPFLEKVTRKCSLCFMLVKPRTSHEAGVAIAEALSCHVDPEWKAVSGGCNISGIPRLLQHTEPSIETRAPLVCAPGSCVFRTNEHRGGAGRKD
jgi:hypothetical protein